MENPDSTVPPNFERTSDVDLVLLALVIGLYPLHLITKTLIAVGDIVGVLIVYFEGMSCLVSSTLKTSGAKSLAPSHKVIFDDRHVTIMKPPLTIFTPKQIDAFLDLWNMVNGQVTWVNMGYGHPSFLMKIQN